MVHKIGVHACPDCNKTFSRLEYVARHRRLKHLGIRPWCCECGTSYARSDLLTRHRRKCQRRTGKASISNNRSAQSKDTNTSQDYVNQPLSPTSNVSLSGPMYYDDHEPPSYQQAIMNLDPPTTSLVVPPEAQTIGSSVTPFHNLPSSPIILRGQEPQQINNQTTSNLTSRKIYPNVSDESQLQADLETTNFTNTEPVDQGRNDEESLTNINNTYTSEGSTFLGDPFDSVIPYIQPNFFINDVPETSPFYLNPNIWVLAFLCQRSQGFTIPHLGTLSRFVSRATQVICPVIPMIHIPTFKTTMTTIHLGYALSVAGAASENSEYAIAFTDQSLTYKRPLVQNDFLSQTNGFNFRFQLLQALLVYQFIGMFSHLETQRTRSMKFSQTIVKNFRDLGFVESLRNSPDYIQLALSGEVPLDLGWKLWVNYEVQKRTAFLVLISSLQLKRTAESELRLSEADLPLPCHEDLWMAKSAEEWISAAQRHMMGCMIDNAKTNSSLIKTSNNLEPPFMAQQTEPLLSEALAALNLSSENCSKHDIPDVMNVGLRSLTIRAHRMGGFARTVIHQTRALACQASVGTRLY